jgi:hypothetical protein
MSDNLYTNRRKRSAQRIRKLVSSRESWIVWPNFNSFAVSSPAPSA